MTRIDRPDALRYLKLSARQLQAWEHKGLISHHSSYTLEEYSRLRTLRDLSLARFSSSRIFAAEGAMRTVAGMEHPFREARAVVGGSRLLFRSHGSVTEPIARQFVFDFEADASSKSASIGDHPSLIESQRTNREGCISELFLAAVRHEDDGDTRRASQLYESLLEMHADHAPSCINLGTIRYNERQFARAEQLYRRATQVDPEYALAFFDLGNVLDELKRLPEAIGAYRTAIRLVPTYADAHYNLALAYERTAERRLALRHWTAYLKLDTASRWATHARKQVRKILEREKLAIVHRSSRNAAPRPARRTLPAATIPTAG